ncbi:acetyltransferase (GNAT) family protein [Nocardiopsis sp. Huas11]|uniref:GNAT family N-acetyltransferase n=1 Tax=Nocardiopsis sp. Huas11 TaxID=2183912 RepID=UPI000EAF9358|nr:GNAT family N-acetyltransferase [Nocardiopsis sp. Huas11]RKS07694.1 acetyltransferase (GNAT) family protein [Nocardiopsis sp. Huas11]
MTIQIRALDHDGLPAAFPLVHACFPSMVLTEEAMRWRHDRELKKDDRTSLVAVDRSGAVVGFARTRLRRVEGEETSGITYLISVDPGHRGTGVEDRLLEAAERSLVEAGAVTLRVAVADEAIQIGGPRLRRVLEEHGYEPSESDAILGLDLKDLPAVPPAPAGSELCSWAEYEGGPRALYDLDRITSADEPGAMSGMTRDYAEWQQDVWKHPLSDLDLSLVLLLDGTPVAITCYISDGHTRLESSMTGTLREFRGRGLARYAKTAALHRARERGYSRAFTGNNLTNDPMLAINRRLGYQRLGTEDLYIRPAG